MFSQAEVVGFVVEEACTILKLKHFFFGKINSKKVVILVVEVNFRNHECWGSKVLP